VQGEEENSIVVARVQNVFGFVGCLFRRLWPKFIADEIKKHGWKCPVATVVFEPPHGQCRFRAYASLQDGAKRWLGHHQRIAAKDAGYVTALNAGDIAAVAHALKVARYYTASETDYARNMTRTRAQIDKALGPLP